MKVFLMHPNRDFELQGTIEQRYPYRHVLTLPPTKVALIEDLELDTLFNAMAQKDEFLFDMAKQAIFSSLDSPEEIRYRQEILKDCLKNPAVVREIYSITIEATDRKHRHWMGIYSRYPSVVLSGAVQMLEMFVILLKRLKRIADEHAGKFESQGFKRFFAMVQSELTEEYFAVVEKHLKTLKFKHGVLISAELGNGNEGKNYILRKPNHDDRHWVKRVFSKRSPIYSYTIHPRDEAGARALGELRDKGINLVANAAGQSADHIDNFFNVLRRELAFYIGCLNLSDQLAQLGEPIAFPDPVPASERQHSFTGLYDVALALTMKKKVVGNDVNANGKDLMIITGANQGGKSTFLRSIGLAQLMMQCGMFVPAESFRANVCTGLFTHYKREEDATMTSGKFDEELSRMSEIVDHITPDSIVLFNESFAATNEREGSEIARQIVSALLEKRVKIFYVTHLYELAHGFYSKGMENAIFLRADRQEHGRRTYKLIEAPPLETSYGMDVYNKIFGEGK
ncbi:MAG: MutS-related protein [Candidatus Villigracilaceae bacterium]